MCRVSTPRARAMSAFCMVAGCSHANSSMIEDPPCDKDREYSYDK